MYCQDCGSEHRSIDRFCQKCGNKLNVNNYSVPQSNYNNMYSQTVSTSYFDGRLMQLIGLQILGFLIVLFTLGIGYPMALCMVYDWEIKHTVINGHRLKFNGTTSQLLGNWIIWLLLCFITCGIFSLWVGIEIKNWKTKHTEFAN